MKIFVITETILDSSFSEWRNVVEPFYTDKLKAEYECTQLTINNINEDTSYYVYEYELDTLPFLSTELANQCHPQV